MSCSALTIRSADDEIHLNALSPYSLRYTVTSNDADFDLSTVTAARFEVLRPDGSTDTWSSLLLENQSVTSVDLVRVFASGDVDIAGLYKLIPYLTVPGGEFVAACRVLKVRELFECDAS
jgi:hypothetical protein